MWNVEIKLHVFLTLKLDRGERTDWHSDRFILAECISITCWTGGKGGLRVGLKMVTKRNTGKQILEYWNLNHTAGTRNLILHMPNPHNLIRWEDISQPDKSTANSYIEMYHKENANNVFLRFSFLIGSGDII